MKYQSIMLYRKWCFLLFIVFLFACTAPIYIKDYAKNWIARPLSELKQAMKSPDSYASKIGWKETTYPLANGNSVYIEPLSENCSIEWEISPRGTIIRYRAEGSGCEQESSGAESFRRALMPPPQ